MTNSTNLLRLWAKARAHLPLMLRCYLSLVQAEVAGKLLDPLGVWDFNI